MNYLLHFSGKIPKYAEFCISSIQKADKDSKIYFICDEKNSYDVLKINTKDISDDLIKSILEINYFNNEENPLWNTSLLRIFYLYNAAKYLNLKSFIHFDLDVLTYESYENLKYKFIENKFNITPQSEKTLIFGYSFIDGIENFEKICKNIYEILQNYSFYENLYNKGRKLNEMMILNIAYIENPNYFNLLKTIPNEVENIIFDGSSYGQYLGGIDKKRFSKREINVSQYAGRAMIEMGYRPKMKSNGPIIEYGGKIYKIANLHIHKKNLSNFLLS